MVKKKFVDPRNGRPSMRALAEKVGSTTTTISEMMYGGRNTSGDLVRRVAVALDVTPMEVARWIGRRATSREPFRAHPDADLLTDDEQQAINDLIKAIAAPRKPKRRPEDAASIVEAIDLGGQRLSVASDTTDNLRAADEQETSISAEQEGEQRP